MLAESSVLVLNTFKLQSRVKCSIKGTAHSPSVQHPKDSLERLYKSQRLIKKSTHDTGGIPFHPRPRPQPQTCAPAKEGEKR